LVTAGLLNGRGILKESFIRIYPIDGILFNQFINSFGKNKGKFYPCLVECMSTCHTVANNCIDYFLRQIFVIDTLPTGIKVASKATKSTAEHSSALREQYYKNGSPLDYHIGIAVWQSATTPITSTFPGIIRGAAPGIYKSNAED